MNNRPLKLNEDLVKKILSTFDECGSLSETSRRINEVCRETIRTCLHKHGKSINRKLRVFPYWFRKYNELEITDQRILGYVCGFIASDGCLVKGVSQIAITLGKTDVDHLKKFALLISDSDKIYPTSVGNFFLVRTLPKLYQYCLDMGITPHKSLTLDVNLEDKSDEFRLYFLRRCYRRRWSYIH